METFKLELGRMSDGFTIFLRLTGVDSQSFPHCSVLELMNRKGSQATRVTYNIPIGQRIVEKLHRKDLLAPTMGKFQGKQDVVPRVEEEEKVFLAGRTVNGWKRESTSSEGQACVAGTWGFPFSYGVLQFETSRKW